jgi:hypothetical protein
MGNAVNHPKHYNEHPSGIECIEVVRHFGFNVGNSIKYLWRAGLKAKDPIEDLEKAIWYINDEIARLKTERARAAHKRIRAHFKEAKAQFDQPFDHVTIRPKPATTKPTTTKKGKKK